MSKRKIKNKHKKEKLKQKNNNLPIEPPLIEIEYIDQSTAGGKEFLELIKNKFKIDLKIDIYHFYYFLALNKSFIAIIETQIYEDMQTMSITNSLFNIEYKDVALALASETFGNAFNNVYIGDISNGAHFIKDKKMSRMFNPWKLKELKFAKIVEDPDN